MKMKQKSLRQLAKELGVSASYLSQVKNGKRPPSKKLLSNTSYELLHSPTSGGDFGSLSPGSNPGSAAIKYNKGSVTPK